MRKIIAIAIALSLSSLCLLPLPGMAQQDPQPVRQAIDQWLRAQTRGLPGQVSWDIGALDAGNQLARCGNFDISRPAGARPWGRTNLTVRCLDAAGWRIHVPVHIRVKADYLLTARPIAQGQTIASDDLATELGDLSELPANTLTEPALAIGKVAASAIPAGRPLRADLLKAPLVIRQGQTVKVISSGPGFAVANEGRAINNALEGQVAQVRLGSGQVVSGIARADGSIQIAY